jgi:hypothetical protein
MFDIAHTPMDRSMSAIAWFRHLCYVRVTMDRKHRGRVFWLALVMYAVWLTIVLRHAIGNSKPLGSLLVLSIVPPLVVVLLWRQSEKWRGKKP